jgi:hypothetical protein
VPRTLISTYENITEGAPLSEEDSARLHKAFLSALGENYILSQDQLLKKLSATVQRQIIDLVRDESKMGAGERVKDFFFQGYWFGSMLTRTVLGDGKIARCDQDICEYAGKNGCPLNLTIDRTWQLEELATQPEFCSGMFEGIASAWQTEETNTHVLCHLSTEAFQGVREFSMSLLLNHGIDGVVDELPGDAAGSLGDQKTPTAPRHRQRAATKPVTVTRTCFSCKKVFPKSRFSSSQLRKKGKGKCLTCVSAGQLVASGHKQEMKPKPAPKATTKRAQASTVPPVEPEEEAPPPLPLCCICMQNIKTHAFIPCGHLMACAGCAEKVMTTSKACPVCRAPATVAARIYAI